MCQFGILYSQYLHMLEKTLLIRALFLVVVVVNLVTTLGVHMHHGFLFPFYCYTCCQCLVLVVRGFSGFYCCQCLVLVVREGVFWILPLPWLWHFHCSQGRSIRQREHIEPFLISSDCLADWHTSDAEMPLRHFSFPFCWNQWNVILSCTPIQR